MSPSMSPQKAYTLHCISCKSVYNPSKDLYTCHACGPLKGTLEVRYPYEELKNTHAITRDSFKPTGGLFQFEHLLPVSSHTPIDHAVGGTPLLKFPDLLGLKTVLIKHDGMSLSASYKDRASVIALNLALEGGYDTIFCASTGNAASSLAILTAHSPLKTIIFVPQTIPSGKLSQLQAAGAYVYPLEGTYDEAFDLSMTIGLSRGWYCRNSAINPYNLEGKKTAAYEILVQNGYDVPDYCLVSVGDGTVVSSLIKGFEEFMYLGLVDRVPRVIGVQAEGAATLKKVFDKGEPFEPIREVVTTIADSISVGDPRDVIKACTYMARNKGRFITVSDESILEAIVEMTSMTGVFAEPAGAVPYAALKKLLTLGEIDASKTCVLVVTGNGLKDPKALASQDALKTYSAEELLGLWPIQSTGREE
jgi:threonine synthase